MNAAIEASHQSSEIFQRLIAGDEQGLRGYIDQLRVQEGASVLAMCEALTEAFHRIGDAWECSELAVYREHIASQIGYRLLLHMRSHLPQPAADAPKAIGCTPENDPYALPTLMVELVLQELGYDARSLGSNLPLEMLQPAIEDVQPKLCWVSVSYIESIQRLRQQLLYLGKLGHRRGVEIVCGGRALTEQVQRGLRHVNFVDQLHQLETAS